MIRWTDGVRAVFFDAVGTLLFPDPPVAEVYARTATQFGSPPPDPVALRDQFRRHFRDEEERDRAAGYRTSEPWERDRWRRIVTACIGDVADPDAAFESLFAHFATPAAWKLAADAAEVLETLHQRGLILGMASNFDARLHGVVAGHPPLAMLSHVVVSSLVGWRKPAPAFFAAVSEIAKLPPDAILFVGDDIGNDYHGASAAGMRAVLLDAHSRHPEVPHRVATLGELIAVAPFHSTADGEPIS